MLRLRLLDQCVKNSNVSNGNNRSGVSGFYGKKLLNDTESLENVMKWRNTSVTGSKASDHKNANSAQHIY